MEVGDPNTGSPLTVMYPGSRALPPEARLNTWTARSTWEDTDKRRAHAMVFVSFVYIH
jgi:hypothetical protein